MRWAGSLLGIGVALGACGGHVGSPVNNGPADAGSGTVGTPPDAGPADAGPPDAGPADAGPTADCIGIVPASTGTALTFDILDSSGKSCAGATGDGNGMMIAEAHDAGMTLAPNDEVQWNVFDTRGAWQGNFRGGLAVVPQPTGYEGTSSGFGTWWDQYGNPRFFVAIEPRAVLAPGWGSGTIAIGATASGIAVHRIDATGNETASANASVSGTPWAGAEDQGGAILAVVQSGAAARGLWFDLAHGTASAAFDLGPASRDALARPLSGGGIAVRLDGRWTATVKPGDTAAYPAPAWLRDGADFALSRSGKAYAVQSGTSAVDLVSVQGNFCGTMTFPGVSSVSLGLDGTVIGATGAGGCTKVFWRGALR